MSFHGHVHGTSSGTNPDERSQTVATLDAYSCQHCWCSCVEHLKAQELGHRKHPQVRNGQRPNVASFVHLLCLFFRVVDLGWMDNVLLAGCLQISSAPSSKTRSSDGRSR